MMSFIKQRKSHDDSKRFFPAVLCCYCAVLCHAIQLVGSLIFAGNGSSGGGLFYMSRLRRKRLVVIGPFASRDEITNVRHHLATLQRPISGVRVAHSRYTIQPKLECTCIKWSSFARDDVHLGWSIAVFHLLLIRRDAYEYQCGETKEKTRSQWLYYVQVGATSLPSTQIT